MLVVRKQSIHSWPVAENHPDNDGPRPKSFGHAKVSRRNKSRCCLFGTSFHGWGAEIINHSNPRILAYLAGLLPPASLAFSNAYPACSGRPRILEQEKNAKRTEKLPRNNRAAQQTFRDPIVKRSESRLSVGLHPQDLQFQSPSSSCKPFAAETNLSPRAWASFFVKWPSRIHRFF